MMGVNKNESHKSNDKAETSRSEGNKLYIDRSFFDALVKYNESLCHAADGSKAVGLAYANRSAVYFEMKLHEKCIRNIELAKANGYPEKNFTILETRVEKCSVEMKSGTSAKEDENPFEFFKLTHAPNEKLPFVAKCLELRKNDEFGRYITTNRDLNVGDIVAIEKPLFMVVKSDARYESCQATNQYQRCVFCLNDNLLDLLPCPGCSSVMFCSVNCRKAAQKAFHHYECPINDRLMKSGIMQMALRTFFQALSMFHGNIDEMQTFVEKNSNPSCSVYDFDFSNKRSSSTEKYSLMSLLCLASSGKVCLSDSPELLLRDHPTCGVWKSHEAFIREFIQRILQVGDSNFHGICGWSLNKYKNQFPQMIGIGCYPFISLVNHSCAPNVNRIYVEGSMLLLVERPIKKGEQLFDCYKNTFFTLPKLERQLILLDEYSFQCECIACSQNFPLFNGLKAVDKKIYKFARKGKAELSKIDGSQAKKWFTEYCSTIQRHHEKAFPSAEIVLLQECISQCLSVIIRPKLVLP